jgi:dolichol-phosphate mannosyltransferase
MTAARTRLWQALPDGQKEDLCVRVNHLSRNFGHQIACTAGLDFATSDAVVVPDADLQDPLPVIHEMIRRYYEGYDVAFAAGLAREGESWFKKLSAWFFYRLMCTLVYKRLPVDAGDFRLISRNCLDGLRQMRETHRFLRGMVNRVGYARIATLTSGPPVSRVDRSIRCTRCWRLPGPHRRRSRFCSCGSS